MRHIRISPTLPTFMLFFTPLFLQAQQVKPSSEIMPLDQVSAIITNAIKKQYTITYPIFRVCKYIDQSGQYYCVLTEKYDSLAEDPKGKKDTLHYAIRAINLKSDSGYCFAETALSHSYNCESDRYRQGQYQQDA